MCSLVVVVDTVVDVDVADTDATDVMMMRLLLSWCSDPCQSWFDVIVPWSAVWPQAATDIDLCFLHGDSNAGLLWIAGCCACGVGHTQGIAC